MMCVLGRLMVVHFETGSEHTGRPLRVIRQMADTMQQPVDDPTPVGTPHAPRRPWWLLPALVTAGCALAGLTPGSVTVRTQPPEPAWTVHTLEHLASRVADAGVDCALDGSPDSAPSLGVVITDHCRVSGTTLELAIHQNRRVLFDGLRFMLDGMACAIRGSDASPTVYLHIAERWSIVTTSRELSDTLGDELAATRIIHHCSVPATDIRQVSDDTI